MDMIERVARASYAAFAAQVAHYKHPPPAWDDLPAPVVARHLASARAGIEAMREPTEDMWEAVGMEPDDEVEALCWPGPLSTWATMIAAALGEPE